MLSFKQDEIYTATEVVRNFSPLIEKLKKRIGQNGHLKK